MGYIYQPGKCLAISAFFPAYGEMFYIYSLTSQTPAMSFKIAPDKQKHFFVGVPLGALLLFAANYFLPGHPVYALLTAFAVLAAICYGFELFSLVTGMGVADNMDAIAGIIGGVIGIALYWGISMFL